MQKLMLSVILCTIIAIICACSTNDRNAMFTTSEVVDFIGVPFPTTANNIFTVGDRGIDTMVAARFDIPQQDLLPYLERLGITESLVANQSPFTSTNPPYPEAVDWWEVVAYDGESGDYAGLYEQIGAKHYMILITNYTLDTVTVYVRVHNT